MTYHSVIDYIRAGRSCGLSDHEVAERLKRAGWLEVDVQDAFELFGKLQAPGSELEAASCPPDHAQHAPTPSATDSLMSRKTPHLSAMRFTMWFVIILVMFYAGYAIMQ